MNDEKRGNERNCDDQHPLFLLALLLTLPPCNSLCHYYYYYSLFIEKLVRTTLEPALGPLYPFPLASPLYMTSPFIVIIDCDSFIHYTRLINLHETTTSLNNNKSKQQQVERNNHSVQRL